MTGLIVFLGFFVSLLIVGFTTERYSWNNGVCRKNGVPWKYFNTDSQGGRGYKAGSETTWISYPFIDNKYQKNLETN